MAVIGPNGAGKTTLLSILAGIQPPDEGRVARPRRGSAGSRSSPALYSKLSVAENLRLFARLEQRRRPRGGGRADARADGLRERADDEVGELSGGNRQRVNIAVGLLAEPAVLLLDEPSSSLDPRQRERLWEFIGGLADRGTTVVFSTHNVGEAERYADRVLVLADGELLFTGTPRARAPGRRDERTSRRRSSPSCTSAATDALAAAQGPPDPAALAAAGRRCS